MITVIIPYQGYPPFDGLLPKVIKDLEKQTIPVDIIVSEQEPVGFINKGKLYDKHVDDARTENILFCDADMMIPEKFCERMLDTMQRFDVVFGTFKKRNNWIKTADGCFCIRQSDWVRFRMSDMFDNFISVEGIPTSLPLFLRWASENTEIGYMIDYNMCLRLPGNTARGHQTTNDRHRVRYMTRVLKDYDFYFHHKLEGGKWLPSKTRP